MDRINELKSIISGDAGHAYGWGGGSLLVIVLVVLLLIWIL